MKTNSGFLSFGDKPKQAIHIHLILNVVLITFLAFFLLGCSSEVAKTTKLAGIATQDLKTEPDIEPSETYALSPTPSLTQTLLIAPTNTSTAVRTFTPTLIPTKTSTIVPTNTLTHIPTKTPTVVPTNTLTRIPTNTITPKPTEITTSLNSCISQNSKTEIATVTNIVDGDTIDVVMDGQVYRVRYIGIDAPEKETPFYEEARKANSDFILEKEVVLISDVSETDPSGLLLRYVYVGDVFVNLEMVKLGLAIAENNPPDSSCSSALLETMNLSRAAQVGIWQATQTPEPSEPIVVIIYVNKEAEYVDIQNNGTAEVNLSGWNLVSEKGNQGCPLSGALGAGETLRIWAMATQEEGYSCGFSKNIWNNSDPDPAVLYNEKGVEVSRK